MSTVDPTALLRAKSRERAARRAGRPAFLVAAMGGAIVMSACAVILGLAIGWLAEDFRHMLIDTVFDDRERMPTYWGPGTIGFLWMIGTFGVMASAIVTSQLIEAYRGGERSPLLLPPVGFCAVAVGIVVDATSWSEPLEVGTAVDPVFHTDETWGVFSWVAYYANVWFPLVMGALAVFVVVGSSRYNRRLRRRITERTRLLSEGRRVEGTITDVTVRTSTNDAGQHTVVGADVVVKYKDTGGIERWVTRRTRDRSLTPGRVEVLFDPLLPDRDDLVFVSFLPDPHPTEWIGAMI